MKGQTRCPFSLLRPSPSHVSHQALSIRLTLSLLLSFYHHHHLTLRRRTPPTLLLTLQVASGLLSLCPSPSPPPHLPHPNTLLLLHSRETFKNPSFKSFHISQPRHPSRQFYFLHRVSSTRNLPPKIDQKIISSWYVRPSSPNFKPQYLPLLSLFGGCLAILEYPCLG